MELSELNLQFLNLVMDFLNYFLLSSFIGFHGMEISIDIWSLPLINLCNLCPLISPDDQFSGQPQHLQQNYTPPLADKVEIYSKPTHFPAPSSTSSSLSSEKPPSGQSPGIAFGSSQITFTYEELLMATNGFSNANLLGQGGFGYVHKGVLPNGKVVAIKQLKAGSGQGEREFQAEIEVISRVHHRHLVSLVGYCISGAQRMLIYEFVPNDTLEFHLHGNSFRWL